MFTLNQHAVPLRTEKDGTKIKALGLHVKAEDIGDRTIRMVASTEDVDRMGDIIRADGWELDRYIKNPVILWGHDHQTPAIATAARTWVEKDALWQDWYFPVEYGKSNPLSESIYVGYKDKVFQASSVGFMPLVSAPIEEEDEEGNLVPTGGVEFKRQELYEVSAVNVPANPYALQELRAKGIDTQPLERMMEYAEGLVIELEPDDDDEFEVVFEPDESLIASINEEDTEEEDGTTGDGEGSDTSDRGVEPVETAAHAVTDEHIARYLESLGYVVLSPEEQTDIEKTEEEFEFSIEEPEDPEPEPEIELEPEPSINEEQLEVVRQTIQGYFAKRKESERFKRALRREINKQYGILED